MIISYSYFPATTRYIQWLMRHRIFRSVRALQWIILFAGAGAIAAGSMNSGAVVKALGSLGEGNRYNAIASFVRGGHIRSPLSSSDGVSILFGTTHGARASSIGELAPLLKADLNGQEAEAILGPEATLSEGNRSNAIAALARAKRFGPSLAEDAALALKGATQGSRAAAIAEIAPYLRADLPGQSIATILGSGLILSDGNRFNAIAAIARSGKKPLPLSGPDGAAILQGATQGSRAAAIGELAPLLKADLNGQEAEAILGPEATLSEGNRSNAIAALARGKRFGPSLAEDAALALKGATQGSRAAAIAEIAPYLRADLPGQSIATILGRIGELTEGNRYNAIAALARAGKLGAVLSSDEMALILLGTSGQTRISAIAEVTNAAKRQGTTRGSGDAAQSTPRPIDRSPSPTLPLAGNIVAAALGMSATNGGTLDLKVPRHIGIEVTFSVTPPSSANYTFSWVIDGKPTGDGARIVRWLPPGQHKVELQAWEAGSYPNSTPATIPAAKTPTRTARMDVNVNEISEWDCLGRLGAGCNDKPTRNFAATTEVTVSIACRGKPDQVCVSSSMSVGAIKHDRCCQERQDQGMAPGYQCEGGSDKEDKSACTAEWVQAELDSKLAGLSALRPSAAIPRFPYTWVYPPDSSNAPSLGKKGWWQALAGSGVIISYSDSPPDEQEQSVCRVGTASRQRIVDMKNSNLLVGPIFSKSHGWICN